MRGMHCVSITGSNTALRGMLLGGLVDTPGAGGGGGLIRPALLGPTPSWGEGPQRPGRLARGAVFREWAVGRERWPGSQGMEAGCLVPRWAREAEDR